MPAKYPRLQVTLTEPQRVLLTELGEIQGRSAASYLRELLDGAEPLLRSLLVLLREKELQISRAVEEVTHGTSETLQNMFGSDPAQLDLVEHLAAVLGHSIVQSSMLLPDGDGTERSDGRSPSAPAEKLP